MQTTELLIAAMQNHVTLLPQGTINMPHWISVAIDQDVEVPTLPYSVEVATLESIRITGNTFRKDDDDHGEEPSVIKAGEYMLIDPEDEYFEVAARKRAWPLALRDPSAAKYSTSEDGKSTLYINTMAIMTHRDTETRHVSRTYFTLLDLLVYAAAQDAKAAGRAADVERILSLTSPNYGIRLDKEQADEVLSHLHDLTPLIVRSTTDFMNTMGASTWKNVEVGESGISYTTIGETTTSVAKSDKDERESISAELRLVHTSKVANNATVLPFNASAATMKLFRILDGVFMESGGRTDEFGHAVVVTTMDHICAVRHIPNNKDNRKAIRKQFANLVGCLTFGYVDDSGVLRKFITSVVGFDTTNNDALTVTFDAQFAAEFWGVHAQMQADDPALYLTDDVHNPNAFPIGCRMNGHMTTNSGRSYQYRLGVSVLLDFCHSIPTHDSIKRRDYKDRRIKPLQRDLDHLVEIGFLKEWHYCHTNGTPLKDGEVDAKGLLEYDAVMRAISKGRDDTFVEWTPAHPYHGHLLKRQDAIERKRSEKAHEDESRRERAEQRKRNREDLIDRKVAEKVVRNMDETAITETL